MFLERIPNHDLNLDQIHKPFKLSENIIFFLENFYFILFSSKKIK